MPEDAGTKLRTVATLAFAFRRSNHLARSRVSDFFVFFRFLSFFSFFRFVSKQFVSVVSLLYRSRDFRLNRNKQKTHPNSLKDSIYGNFSENLGLFRFVSVSYKTDLFVSVVSIKVRKTETNRSIFFLVSRNKPKQTRNRSCFGLFRFEPKFIFVCFEDTLPGPYCRRPREVNINKSIVKNLMAVCLKPT